MGKGIIEIANRNGFAFSNSRENDLIICTTSNSQRILIGPGPTNITVSSNLVDIGGNLNFTGSLTQGGVPFQTSRWSSNANGIFIMSNVAIGGAVSAISKHPPFGSAPGYIASASSEMDAARGASSVIDGWIHYDFWSVFYGYWGTNGTYSSGIYNGGSSTTFTSVSGNSITQLGEWWQLKLPAPTVLTSMRFAGMGVGRCALVGAVDNTLAFQEIFYINDGNPSFPMGTEHTITFPHNTTAYLYYRFIIITTVGGIFGSGKTALSEVTFFGDAITASGNVMTNTLTSRAIHTDTLSIANGSVTMPTLTFAGDTDTGIFRPSINTIALGTTGVERFRINSNGNVGIGTTAPDNRLHIAGGGLNLQNGNTGTATTDQISFGFSGNNLHKHGIRSRHNSIADGNGNAIDFFIWQMSDGATGNASTQIMSITRNGVGIGTSTPAHTLDVAGSVRINGSLSAGPTSEGVYIGNYGSSRPGIEMVGATDAIIDFTTINNDTRGRIYYVHASDTMTLRTAAADRLTITGTGNVGINTATPSARLHVNGGRIFIGDSGKETTSASVSGANGMSNMLVFDNWFDANSTINTSTPANKIRLHTGVNNNWIAGFGISGDALNYHIGTTGNHVFWTGSSSSNYGTERMRITDTGLVGIGVTPNASYRLDVSGAARISSNLDVGLDGTPGIIRLGGPAGDTPFNYAVIANRLYNEIDLSELVIFKGNDSVANSGPDRIRLRAAELIFDTYPSGSEDFTATNPRMVISSSGNVGIGTTAPNFLLDVAGNMRASEIRFTSSGTGLRWENINTDGAEIKFHSSGDAPGQSYLEIKTFDNGDEPIVFTQQTTERMRIHTNGFVGIGTTAPGALLDVAGASRFGNPISQATYEYPPSALVGTSTNISSARIASAIGTYIVSHSSNSMNGVHAFDKNDSTYWTANLNIYSGTNYNGTISTTFSTGSGSASILGEWLQITLPSAITLHSYSIRPTITESAPATWVLLGSTNGGTSWTLVDDQRNIWYGHNWWRDMGRFATFTVSSSTAYSTYRIAISRKSDTGYWAYEFVGINEFTLNTTVAALNSGNFIRTELGFIGPRSDTSMFPSYSWSGDQTTGMFRAGMQTLGFATGGIERLRIESAGNVSIGNFSPAARLDIAGVASEHPPFAYAPGYTISSSVYVHNDARADLAFNYDTGGWGWAANGYQQSTGNYVGTEKTTAGGTDYFGQWLQLQFPAARVINGIRFAGTGVRRHAIFGSQNGTTWTLINDLTQNFSGAGGYGTGPWYTVTFGNGAAYSYYRFVYMAAIANNFGWGEDTDKVRITELRYLEAPVNQRVLRLGNTSGGDSLVVDWNGNMGIGTSTPANRLDVVGGNARIYRGDDNSVLTVQATSSRKPTLTLRTDHGGNNRVAHILAVPSSGHWNTRLEFKLLAGGDMGGNGSEDLENATLQMSINPDGNVKARSAFQGGGADYAEMFEWEDQNLNNEDRRGMTVVLANEGKIRLATSTDQVTNIFGAVSVTYCILGNNSWNNWQGKYLKDEFGSTIKEDVTIVKWNENGHEISYDSNLVPANIIIPTDAIYFQIKRDQINPSYDSNAIYIPRDERLEWAAIGFLGKLRIRNSSPKNPLWIKLRDINETVAEYLIK